MIRMPCGAGIHAPEHHSESPEAYYAHIPGLRVVIPSSASKAYGLLLASIRNPDPVVFMEPTRAYRFKDEVTLDGKALPLDTSFVLREGADVTLVSWGALVTETLEAAHVLHGQGVEAEVIDVATLGTTFDFETILASFAKTQHCVIVHEATCTGGFGAEIVARLADEGLNYIAAPIKRVTSYDTIVPLARLEHDFMPGVPRILRTVKEVLKT